MARLCKSEVAARQSTRLVFLAVSSLAVVTLFSIEHVFAQVGGAPVVTETGKAESGGQATTVQQRSKSPAQDPQKVQEAPYPGGPGRRVEEAPYPGTIGGKEELQRQKRLPGASGGISVDPPAPVR